jgi:hypothetical protein
MTKKELIAEYKARKPARGAFAVRCTANGQTWVGASPNLNTAQNSIWFTLRLGSHYDKALQAAWAVHGEHAFEYEILEKLDDDLSPMAVKDLLKEKRLHWATKFRSHTLL